MGMEIPSRSLGYAHLAILAALVLLAIGRPGRAIRLSVLAVLLAITLALPSLWVGPAWESPPELERFAWGFFLSFVSSLGIPFAGGALAVTVLARREAAPRLSARIGWPVAAYLVGLVVSLPVSFNYALAYPFMR